MDRSPPFPQPDPESPVRTDAGDRLGILVSAVCAVHCALLPVLLLLIPGVGDWFGDERLEWALLSLAGLIALWGLGHGYRRHRSTRVVLLILLGLGLLVTGRWLETSSGPILAAITSVLGAGLLIAAHALNLRLCRARRRARQLGLTDDLPATEELPISA